MEGPVNLVTTFTYRWKVGRQAMDGIAWHLALGTDENKKIIFSQTIEDEGSFVG